MNVVGPLAEAGYTVCGYDQRGHGVSPGPRVHINRWTEYREDLTAYLMVVAEQVPGVPIVLYGHSMGSLVVLDYLLHRQEGLAGAIISGIAIEPVGVGSRATIATARVLTHVLPRLSINLGIDASDLTRDPQALADYAADPLVTGRATVRWGTESLDTVARIKEGMAGIDLPILVIHGGADKLNCPEGAKALVAAVPNADKTLRIYPGVCHEPHNDVGHEQVAADIEEWLGTRLG
jgi:alpha-beta hydrolase superfamily lysophospholipase